MQIHVPQTCKTFGLGDVSFSQSEGFGFAVQVTLQCGSQLP